MVMVMMGFRCVHVFRFPFSINKQTYLIEWSSLRLNNLYIPIYHTSFPEIAKAEM